MRKFLKAMFLFSGALAVPPLSAKVLRVPSEFPTITAAMARANSGDSVVVSPGTYRENVTLAQGVVLAGLDPLKCVIDGMRRGPSVYAVTGSEISGFTITNGVDGVLCENAVARIHHNRIVGNEGSGVAAFIALPQVDNNVIHGNRWSGVLVWGAKALDSRVENNVILRNGYSGLALRGPSRVVIRNNIIMENHEYGIYSDPAAGQSQITYNDIYHNDVFPFNRYTNAASKSNVSLDPMFLEPGRPDYFLSPRSPLIRRGYEQLDIGLSAREPLPPGSGGSDAEPSPADSPADAKPIE